MGASTQDGTHRAIADSMAAHPATARIGGPAVLDHASAARLLASMREIAFPGFHPVTHAAVHEDAETFVAERVRALRAGLVQCIAAAARAVDASAGIDEERMADELVTRIPAIRELLAADVQAAFRGDPAARTVAEVILCYPGIAAMTAHRFAHELWIREVPILPRMLSELAHSTTGIDIHPGARIGRGVFIDHGTGVVIGETCEIGSHVKLYQGVTLGAVSFQTDGEGNLVRGTKRHPTIEDFVVIYANATVLGGTTRIGHHSVIGSNVWLTRSVDPHTTVVLERPKLRMRGEAPELENDYQI